MIYTMIPPRLIKTLGIFCAVVLCAVLCTTQALAGQVAVSNYPLYLLSQAVTKGQNDASVLLQAGDVGHHGSLPPSKVKRIKDATYVVWFGQNLESNLAKNLNQAPNAISLLDMNAFDTKPLRDIDGNTRPDTTDPHIWLDPTNAKKIVAVLTVVHSHANPQYKAIYQQNAQAFYQKMDEVAKNARLPTQKPYWAYHDAFLYLEKSLNLRFFGALTPDHHLSPKASRFKILNSNRPTKTMCLASQSPISAGIQEKLSPIATVVRQEDMSDSTDFIGAWQALADDFTKCVG